MSDIEEITVPSPGESISEVYIATVFAKPGDFLSEGQAILEVDSDKATFEVPSPILGKVLEVLVGEGDEVPTGAIARVELGDAPASSATVDTTSETSQENMSTGPAARHEVDKLNVDINTAMALERWTSYGS